MRLFELYDYFGSQNNTPHRCFKGGGPKAPKALAPVATVRQLDEEVKQKDRDRRKQRIAAAGRAGSILTQGQGLADTGKATILGRSTA